jgi:ketosteroid isomerase-like protein
MNDEKRLLKLDNQWNEAYPKRDADALNRIIADDWIGIDGAGIVISKEQLLERVKTSASFLKPYKFDETVLRIFSGTAIVTGRLSGRDHSEDETFYLEQRYTRVYVKRNDCWQSVATQVTVVKHEQLLQ